MSILKIHKVIVSFLVVMIVFLTKIHVNAIVKILNNDQGVNYMDIYVFNEGGELKYNNNKELEGNIFMDKITNDKDLISGKSFKNCLIKFLINDVEYISNTDDEGRFVLLLEEGLLVDVDQINIRVYDYLNNELSNASFVVHDVLVPIDPKIDNMVTNVDKYITGYGEANSFIKILINDEEFTGYIPGDGMFKIEVGDSLRESNSFCAISYDYFNNYSNMIEKQVKDVIAPSKPEIKMVDCNTNIINGKGEPNCEIIVYFDNKIYKGHVNNEGEFCIFDEEGCLSFTDSVTAKLIDSSGNNSDEVHFKVQKENVGSVILKSMDLDSKTIKDAMIKLSGIGNGYVNEDTVFNLNSDGNLLLEELPFGDYELVIRYRNDEYKLEENILQISINQDSSQVEVLIE